MYYRDSWHIFSQDFFTYRHYQYVFKILMRTLFSFIQVASSAVRPLTNIPHCCTYLHWGFFRPNVVDQPFSFDYKNFKLVKLLL